MQQARCSCPQQASRPVLHRGSLAPLVSSRGRPLHRCRIRQSSPSIVAEFRKSRRGLGRARDTGEVQPLAATGGNVDRAYGELQQPTELQQLINNIPYKRLCIWAGVALAAWPLHSFFGVSAQRVLCCAGGGGIALAATGRGFGSSAASPPSNSASVY